MLDENGHANPLETYAAMMKAFGSESPPLEVSLLAAFEQMGDAQELDKPLRNLALKYARAIDTGKPSDLNFYGGRLLNCLVELGMSPRARVAMTGQLKDEGNDEPRGNAKLRSIRERRTNPGIDSTETMDSAS